MFGLLRKVLGSANERELKRVSRVVEEINTFEAGLSQLQDEQLRAKTDAFRQRLAKGASLDQLLPEAFAVVREAGRRILKMRHFDVQMIGGFSLHKGRIAEMRTGEGKTLVATLPVYLNALSGKGVHVVTVNDYLARRDADWMRPLYEFLDLSIGVVVPDQDPEEKRKAYQADITYGTNNEFGFDYLRDNMAFSTEDKMQRALNFAIVDEVDSILIDEARTPLIISGPADDSSELYQRVDKIIPQLKCGKKNEADELVVAGDYTLDEKARQIDLTEQGHQLVEELMQKEGLLPQGASLYAPQHLMLLHHILAALKAHAIFHKNVDYIVRNNEVILVDEHTGRTMQGRRLSEGLHQALEAKERVYIQPESQTLASTTFQNYFRLYAKLAGMTGTADTEAYEFKQIYDLDVIVIPTHKPTKRADFNDLVYLSLEEKYEAIVADIQQAVKKAQPVLVGTASIDASELLSKVLKKSGIRHEVLNAKFHEREADIIAQAGRPGAVTIATNMAGRGTDIVLGGNLEAEIHALKNPQEEQIKAITALWKERHQQVIDAGGLYIIGTERHESRRIDNQLRGRSGRQGDPGASRFYLSLEDNLMRIFASDRVKNFMKALGMQHGEAIEHRMVSNAIEKAQRKVEGRNFDIRKQLLEYDDIANEQREMIYKQRNDIMATEDVSDVILSMRQKVIGNLVHAHIPPQSLVEQWDIDGLEQELMTILAEKIPLKLWLEEDENLMILDIQNRIFDAMQLIYTQKEKELGAENLRMFEKHVLLRVLDEHWKEHLAAMDHLRQGIHLRGYAAKNPKQEYKRESFELFESMLEGIRIETIKMLSHIEVADQHSLEAGGFLQKSPLSASQKVQYQHPSVVTLEERDHQASSDEVQEPFIRVGPKVGRNEPCPCGSGKKYKHCHGKIV